MKRKLFPHFPSTNRRGRRAVRIAAGTAAVAFSLANVDHAYGQGYGPPPVFVEATEGDWRMNVIANSGPRFRTEQEGGGIINGGFHDWSGFQGVPARPGGSTSSNSVLPEQVYAQWFFFRDNLDFNGPERLLETLGFDGVVPTAGDKIELNYGTSLDAPYTVNLTYDLNSISRTQSNINVQLTITNVSSQMRDLTFFMYSAFRLDGTNQPQDVVQNTGITSFRYQSGAGSNLDVNALGTRNPGAIGGGTAQNPDRFEIARFPGVLQKMDDAVPSQLSNSSVFAGPGTVEHGFQWNISSMAPDDVVVLNITLNGSFRALTMPISGSGGVFTFSDGSPPAYQQTRRWYDPDPATGFVYQITEGTNSFAEISLPGNFTDGQYELEILDPSHPLFGVIIPLTGDGMALSYDFIATDNDGMGVMAFRITGIEAEANVDPENPFGFPTGLTFRTSDPVDFTMTAIPEPSAIVLLALGALLVAARRRRG